MAAPALALDFDPAALAVERDGVRWRSVWAPQPGPQTAAIRSEVEDLFYGGQRGGGKTDFLLGDFGIHAGLYGAHAHGVIFRRTYDELDQIIQRSRAIYGPMGWKYQEQKRTWVAPSGATLKMRYLDRDADAEHYRGHEYTWVAFDEADQFPDPAPLDKLRACLRSSHGVPSKFRLTGNPGGVGHHWLKARYIEPAPPMQPHRWQPQPDTHPDLWVESVFIPARLEDNVLLMRLDPRYEQRLAAATQGNAALWQAWRYGNWDVVAGAAFDEWNREVHVIPRFHPPLWWEPFGGMDAGTRNPSWVGLMWRGPEGEVVVSHEWYWRGKDFRTAGKELGYQMRLVPAHELPDEWEWNKLLVWGDSSMFSDSGVGGLTQATEFQAGLDESFGGRPFAPTLASAANVKGPGSRRMGVALVRQMLHWERAKDGTVPPHRQPRLRIHERCKHLIRTLPALPVSPKDPEDVDTEAEDHPFDGLKMALLANVPSAERPARGGFDENRHPGFRPTGQRRRPKKPLSEQELIAQHQRRYTTGVRVPFGPNGRQG